MTLTNTEIKNLKEWVKKTFNINGADIHNFDVHAEIDRKINFEENKTQLREKLKSLFHEIKPIKEEVKTHKEIQESQRLKEYKEQEEQNKKDFYNSIEKIKDNLKTQLDVFNIPAQYILSVAKGFNKAFLFYGSAGVGKTFLTRQILIKENCDFVESRGVSSALALYHFLYNNNDEKKVFLFDDVHGLINNANAFSILLGALWDGLISWNTTSDKLQAPMQFMFKSKIIIIANKIDNHENIDVLKSRCLCYNLTLTWKEKIESMYLIAEQKNKELTREERIKIVDFIKDNSDDSTKDFDLRSQYKIEKLYLYDKNKWKELSLPLLNSDEILSIILDCIKKSNSMKEAEKIFIEETGLSRRSFYRYKQKMKGGIE